MVLPYKIEVEYGEISVFPAGYEAPCHDWADDDVAQGFCWHATQIAFLTLHQEGVLEVTVQIENEVELLANTIRAIQVPIFVGEDSPISIWPTSQIWFDIPEGEYCLVYQTGFKPVVLESQKKLGNITPEWNDTWCVLTFIRQENVEAKILRRDEKLHPPISLRTTDRSGSYMVQLSTMPDSIYYEDSID